jgi:N-acyl-D-amino-acid deacylase
VKKGTLRLYDAIEKMTAQPAARLGLTNKGRLNVGADADITIFDYDAVTDRATFAEPALAPEGIEMVLIGGEIALQKGEILKSDCGKAVRK